MCSDYDYSDKPALHYDALNSQARSCCMLVKLLNIDMDFQPTDTIDVINYNDIYSWINSFCTLPVLMDNRITLCSGHSILIYLCNKYAPPNLQTLCPCDYTARIKLTSMLFYEGFVLQRCLTHLLTDIFLAKYPNFDVEYHKKKVHSVYTSMNAFLKNQNFLIGNRLTIADISAVATMSAFNIIFPVDCDEFPKLYNWLQCLKKMNFYSCNQEGIQKLCCFLKNVCEFPSPSPFSLKPPSTTAPVAKSGKAVNAQAKRTSEPKTPPKFVKQVKKTEKLNNASKKEQKIKEKPPGFDELEENKNSDTYFVNVCKCKCCSKGVAKSATELQQDDALKYNDIAKYLQTPDPSDILTASESEETQEIFRRQDSCECRSSVEAFGILECKSDIEMDKRYCTCPIDIKDNRSKQTTNRLSPSSDSSLEIVDQVPLKQMDKTIKKVDDCVWNIINTKLTQTDDRETPNLCLCLTNEKIQDLMEKIQKYEKILEVADKALIDNKNILATIPSNFSRDSKSVDKSIKSTTSNSTASGKYGKSDNSGTSRKSGNSTASGKYAKADNSTMSERSGNSRGSGKYDKSDKSGNSTISRKSGSSTASGKYDKSGNSTASDKYDKSGNSTASEKYDKYDKSGNSTSDKYDKSGYSTSDKYPKSGNSTSDKYDKSGNATSDKYDKSGTSASDKYDKSGTSTESEKYDKSRNSTSGKYDKSGNSTSDKYDISGTSASDKYDKSGTSTESEKYDKSRNSTSGKYDKSGNSTSDKYDKSDTTATSDRYKTTDNDEEKNSDTGSVAETELESYTETERSNATIMGTDMESTTYPDTGTESKTDDSPQNEPNQNKRLRGGLSPDPKKSRKNSLIPFEKFKNTNADFDERISHIEVKKDHIICVIYSKRNSTELNNYCCHDCCKKMKTLKSKIPRLVSNKSLMSDKTRTTPEISTKEIGCGVSTHEMPNK